MTLGVICGAVYLIIMFLFITVLFYKHLAENKTGKFLYHEVSLHRVQWFNYMLISLISLIITLIF